MDPKEFEVKQRALAVSLPYIREKDQSRVISFAIHLWNLTGHR